MLQNYHESDLENKLRRCYHRNGMQGGRNKSIAQQMAYELVVNELKINNMYQRKKPQYKINKVAQNRNLVNTIPHEIFTENSSIIRDKVNNYIEQIKWAAGDVCLYLEIAALKIAMGVLDKIGKE